MRKKQVKNKQLKFNWWQLILGLVLNILVIVVGFIIYHQATVSIKNNDSVLPLEQVNNLLP